MFQTRMVVAVTSTDTKEDELKRLMSGATDCPVAVNPTADASRTVVSVSALIGRKVNSCGPRSE